MSREEPVEIAAGRLTDYEFLRARLKGLRQWLREEGAETGVDAVAEALDRLEALEEIRQRVADGWTAVPDREPILAHWTNADLRFEHISPAVAALLWPDPPEGT